MKRKSVFWICDKQDCLAVNTREIPLTTIINDDFCDCCGKRIHEPVVETTVESK